MVKPLFNVITDYDLMSDRIPLSDAEVARRFAGYLENYPAWRAKDMANKLWEAQRNDQERFEAWIAAGKPDLHAS